MINLKADNERQFIQSSKNSTKINKTSAASSFGVKKKWVEEFKSSWTFKTRELEKMKRENGRTNKNTANFHDKFKFKRSIILAWATRRLWIFKKKSNLSLLWVFRQTRLIIPCNISLQPKRFDLFVLYLNDQTVNWLF